MAVGSGVGGGWDSTRGCPGPVPAHPPYTHTHTSHTPDCAHPHTHARPRSAHPHGHPQRPPPRTHTHTHTQTCRQRAADPCRCPFPSLPPTPPVAHPPLPPRQRSRPAGSPGLAAPTGGVPLRAALPFPGTRGCGVGTRKLGTGGTAGEDGGRAEGPLPRAFCSAAGTGHSAGPSRARTHSRPRPRPDPQREAVPWPRHPHRAGAGVWGWWEGGGLGRKVSLQPPSFPPSKVSCSSAPRFFCLGATLPRTPAPPRPTFGGDLGAPTAAGGPGPGPGPGGRAGVRGPGPGRGAGTAAVSARGRAVAAGSARGGRPRGGGRRAGEGAVGRRAAPSFPFWFLWDGCGRPQLCALRNR